MDKDGNIVETAEVDIALSEVLPETVIKTKTVLRQIENLSSLDDYTICLGIVDPMTEKNAIRFAMEHVEQYGNALVLWNP